MKEIRIIGIQLFDRIKEAGLTQGVLSKYADCIKTRLGFHELNQAVCSRIGIILLELCGEPQKWDKMETELREIGGIEIQKMQFNL